MSRADFARILDAELLARRQRHTANLHAEHVRRATERQRREDARIVSEREQRVEARRAHERVMAAVTP